MPATLPLFLAASLLLAITPGPGLFYVAARALAGGRREGIASSLGTALGGLVHVAAGTAGISAVILASAELFTALKLLGAAYLAWLGLRTILAARSHPPGQPTPPPIGSGRAFREGILVEALNPKTAAFFLAFIPQFVDPAGNAPLQFALLGLASVALNTAADIAVAIAAGTIQAGLATTPTLIRRLRQASGAAMVALGLGLLLAPAPHRRGNPRPPPINPRTTPPAAPPAPRAAHRTPR